MAPNPEYTIKVLRSGDFDERFLSAWEELEGRAMEPNGYLSPHFVIPAIKFITNKDNLLGIIVEKTNRGGVSSTFRNGVIPHKQGFETFPPPTFGSILQQALPSFRLFSRPRLCRDHRTKYF